MATAITAQALEWIAHSDKIAESRNHFAGNEI